MDTYPQLRKWLVVGIIVMFLSMHSCVNAKIQRTIYVDDDNTSGPWDGTQEHPFRCIQDGVDASSENDMIFVYNGFYKENLNIDKPVVLIGENNTSTKIYGRGGDLQLINITADNVTLQNFLIEQESVLYPESNYQYLIRLLHVQNVSVLSNHFRCYNIWGDVFSFILLDDSCYCVIENNYLNSSANTNGFNDWGVYLSYSDHNRVSKNIIQYYWQSGISLFNSNYNMIANNSVTHSGWGFQVFESNYNTIKENIITQHECDGIYLFVSSGNIIQQNQISFNNETGIRIFEGSYSTITNNDIRSNGWYGIEIYSNGFYYNLFITSAVNRTACLYNIVSYNNFIDNRQNAFFVSSYFTTWKMNYWGESRTAPYLISGITTFFFLQFLPVLNFDWHPAQEPYDIPGMS
jgi:parallel beta-helix repeat protein